MAAALEIPVLNGFDSAQTFATEIPPPAYSIGAKIPEMGAHGSDTEAPDAKRLEIESHDLGTEVDVDPASDRPSPSLSPPAASVAKEQVHSPLSRPSPQNPIQADLTPSRPAPRLSSRDLTPQ